MSADQEYDQEEEVDGILPHQDKPLQVQPGFFDDISFDFGPGAPSYPADLTPTYTGTSQAREDFFEAQQARVTDYQASAVPWISDASNETRSNMEDLIVHQFEADISGKWKKKVS